MNRSLNLQQRNHLSSIFDSILFGLLPILIIVPSLEAAIIPTGNVEPGGTWTSSTTGYVGRTSDGSVFVDAGSVLQSRTGYIANNSGVSGTATVTGTGSKWTNSGDLYVGQYGSGTLRIEGGGQISTSSDGCLGRYSGSSGTATITGAGSMWTNKASLVVGEYGTGTLCVEVGGQVSSSYGGYLGDRSGSSGTATITGAGSLWTIGNGNFLYVGRYGTGTLRIEAGGQVSNSYGNVGYGTGSTGSVTVTGIGSKWTNSDDLIVGYDGFATLRIEAGGQVSNSSALLGGQYSGSSGTVTGTGSKWTNSGSLSVGYSGNGTLRIEAGGQVSNSDGYLGYDSGSSGTMMVTGAGSKWTNSGTLYVGRNGKGTLTVADGGEVTAGTLYASLGSLLGNGTITATKGAVLDVDLRFDAAHPSQVTFPFGSGGTLTVNVAGGDLGAGYKGNGSLTVAEGVAVTSSWGYLGYHTGSSGAATVTGTGSKWTSSSNLFVGYNGTGTLRIEAGGQVSNSYGYLGYNSGSSGTATVTGIGSKWTNSNFLYVGHQGIGTLCIEAGGQVSNNYGFLGLKSGSSGTATITGVGSMWTNGSLCVGDEGSGALRIEAGGQVSNFYGNVGYGTGSTGSVTVTGVGSKWTNSYSLYIGSSGTGTLRIEAGGQVSNTTGCLGQLSGSSGTATVTGAGSKWTNSSSLSIGSGTVSGTAHIRDGGVITASSVSVSGNSLLSLDAGYGSNLRVGSSGTGTITNSGKVRVLAGPQPAAGNQYSPIAAGTWTGDGTYQALGGTWDASSHVLTVSETLGGVSGTPVAVDLAQRQRVMVEETAKGWTVGTSFLAKTGSGNNFDFSATAVAGTDLTALSGLLEPGQSVLSGWNFTAVGSGYSASDPIYLSLGISASLNHGNVQLWRQSGGNWSRFTADDLTAVDGYASFTITGLSGYAVAGFLPSPAWKTDADGLWQNEANWSTDPNTPGGINTAAVLGSTITAPRTISLSEPLTLGVLTFDSAQHYTLSGTDELKLQVNPTYTAEIDVKQSDAHGHVIETPITLASPLEITLAPLSSLTLSGQVQNPTGQPLTLSGGGTLMVAQGLVTTGAIHVQAGTLITPSLTADTLTIGGGVTPPLAAVPEPATIALVGIGAFGLIGFAGRRMYFDSTSS